MVHDFCLKTGWPLWGVVQLIEHPVANAGAAARAPPAEPDPHLDICHFGNTIWQFDALILVTQNPIVLLSYFIHHRYTSLDRQELQCYETIYDFSKAPPAQRLWMHAKTSPLGVVPHQRSQLLPWHHLDMPCLSDNTVSGTEECIPCLSLVLQYIEFMCLPT